MILERLSQFPDLNFIVEITKIDIEYAKTKVFFIIYLDLALLL